MQRPPILRDALHARWPDNVLCRGRVDSGDVDAMLARLPAGARCARLRVTTRHVEHAYIEPEAGYAEWEGDRVHVFACTQTPYLDRDEVASVMGIEPAQVRIEPSAIGGGFGGKLDVSVQPLLAVAAKKTGRAVRTVWDRPESMIATTKRHPAEMTATLACSADGDLLAYDFTGDFNTGAYSSWGPTVANRVPIHASGPYRLPNVRALTRAVLTNNSVAGAFRGFGVPQSTIVVEALVDELALSCGIDALEFRYRNALRAGDRTPTGQRLDASVGMRACLDRLRPAWAESLARARRVQCSSSRLRRAVAPRCRDRLHVVRHRQHRHCESVDDDRRPARQRPLHAVQRRAGDRAGHLHHHAPDSGAGARRADRADRPGPWRHRCHRGRGQVVGFAPDLRVRQRGTARRARPAAQARASRRVRGSGRRCGRRGRQRRRRGCVCAGARPAEPSFAGRAADGPPPQWRGAAARARAVAGRRARQRRDRPRHLQSADGAARCRRPGCSLCHLRLRRPGRGGHGRHGPGAGHAAAHPCGARCRARHQSHPHRRPDPRRHCAGHRPRADGGIRQRPHRQPARLPDPDRRRRAADHHLAGGGSRAARPLRREGCRRAGAGGDRARHPQCGPDGNRRAAHRSPGDACARAGGAAAAAARRPPGGRS